MFMSTPFLLFAIFRGRVMIEEDGGKSTNIVSTNSYLRFSTNRRSLLRIRFGASRIVVAMGSCVEMFRYVWARKDALEENVFG